MIRYVAAVLVALLVATPIATVTPAAADDVATEAAWPIGADAALVLDADGLAVVAFTTFDSLQVLRCTNVACDEFTTAVLDGPYDRPSIAIDSSNRAVIAARHRDDRQLVVLGCESPACSALSQPSRPAPELAVLAAPSLVLDTQDRPIIAALDNTTLTMRLITCDDALCSAAATVTSPVPTIATVAASPLELDGNGRGVIALIDAGNNEVLVLRCGNADCTGANTIAAVGTALSFQLGLKLTTNDRPLVSVARYLGSGDEGIDLRRCDDPACSTFAIIEIDTGIYAQSPTSLALDATDRPAIAYFDQTAQDLQITRCDDPACGARTTTAIERTGYEGVHASLALDAAGLPVIAHRNASNNQLELLRCDDANCEPDSAIDLTGDANCDGVLNILDAFATAQYVVDLRGGVASCAEVSTGEISLGAVSVDDAPVTIQNAFWVAQCVVEVDSPVCPDA